VLLGHKNGSITTHYSGAEIGELIDAVGRIDASRSTPVLTTLRIPSVTTVAHFAVQRCTAHNSTVAKALQAPALRSRRDTTLVRA